MKKGLEKYFEAGQVDLSKPDQLPVEEVQTEENGEQETTEDQQGTSGQAEEPQSGDEPVQDDSTEQADIEELQEIEEEKVEDIIDVEEKPHLEIALPEGIDKLVDFINETGGTVQDYVELNRDYSGVSEKALLREYYNKTKSHLDSDDINYLLDKKFNIDEEGDEVEQREQKIALKEELGKAKSFLEDQKSKYYNEIKANGGAMSTDPEVEKLAQEVNDSFVSGVDTVFTKDFKGFTFDVGDDKKIRYKSDNVDNLKKKHSDLGNILGGFLDEKGRMSDPEGYHKSLFAATNPDKFAELFYKQGIADAVKKQAKDSKNLDFDHVQKPPSSNTKLQPGQAREINPGRKVSQKVNLKYFKGN